MDLTGDLCLRQTGKITKEEEFSMNKRAFLVLGMICLLATAAVPALASAEDDPAGPSGAPMMMQGPMQPGPGGAFAGRRGHGPSLEALQKKLGITDEQKKQIRNLYVAFQDQTRKARTELMSLMDQKKTMKLSGKIDLQKMAQIDDQIVKLRSDVLRERLKMRRDRLGLLTPEQVGKIADMKAEGDFRSGMGRMHGGQMHGGPMHGGQMHRGGRGDF